MVERSDVERFIDDYRRAFERFDVARVVTAMKVSPAPMVS